tara:strand:- start:263 stop:508 length:246 start_codon:yes stop_codon:yes gene_type:complete
VFLIFKKISNTLYLTKNPKAIRTSIASGNHVCNPNWADFPTAPTNKKKHIIFIIFILKETKLKQKKFQLIILLKVVMYSTP